MIIKIAVMQSIKGNERQWNCEVNERHWKVMKVSESLWKANLMIYLILLVCVMQSMNTCLYWLLYLIDYKMYMKARLVNLATGRSQYRNAFGLQVKKFVMVFLIFVVLASLLFLLWCRWIIVTSTKWELIWTAVRARNVQYLKCVYTLV